MGERDISGSACSECGAACCRYIATELDPPRSKRDYDHIRWYLLHRNVHVFVDHDGGWFLEFEAECKSLMPDHRCAIYNKRPRICRSHGEGEVVCEYMVEEEPHTARFSDAQQFERYLRKKGIDWQWRERKARKK